MRALYAALLCVGAAILCAHLKKRWPELAIGIAVATGMAVIAAFIPDLKSAVDAMAGIARQSGLQGQYVLIMLRACGISLIAEFAAQACRDAGESALSGRILLCARLALLGMAAPLITDILARLSRLLLL